ncbi:hypothetical protein [Roseovarius arcticus]|uniref:hypothetical protein n=1 Tax=Roseovarius arcticus TaxID=2547404 RepID=UPI0011100652|nr:hypothetical protein [Roseovarius arcticus]
MQWVYENWLLLLVGGGMIAMHLFGHGHGHKSGRKNAHHHSTKKTAASDLKTTGRSKEGSND